MSVGVPGDRIKIVNKALYLNGVKLSEPYAQNSTDYVDSYRDNFPSERRAVGASIPPRSICCSITFANGEVVVPPGDVFRRWEIIAIDHSTAAIGDSCRRTSVLGRAILVTYSYDENGETARAIDALDSANPDRRYLTFGRRARFGSTHCCRAPIAVSEARQDGQQSPEHKSRNWPATESYLTFRRARPCHREYE